MLGIYLVQMAPHPWMGGVLAFGSHYLLDLIPHGDEGLGRWIKAKPKRVVPVVLIDFIVLGACIFLIVTQPGNIGWATVIVGAVASTLPDWLSECYMESHDQRAPFYSFLKYLSRDKMIDRLLGWHHRAHHNLHYYFNREISWPVGFGWQALLAGFFLCLMLWK